VLTEAAAQSEAVVQFEKGAYRLDPGGAEAFIDPANACDLTIDGGGSTFVFTGFLKFVRLNHCRRVTVRNFTFDFDPLPYTAGRVVEVNRKAGTFDVEIAPGHPAPESHRRFDEDRKGMIVDPAGPHMKEGVRLILEHAGWQKLGERRCRFMAANPRQLNELAPGDDICHVNCLVMGIQEKLGPNRVRLPLNNPYDRVGASVALDIQPGDELQFYNRAEGRLISERKVVTVSIQGKALDVTLDGDVGDVVPGRPGVKRIRGGKTLSVTITSS